MNPCAGAWFDKLCTNRRMISSEGQVEAEDQLEEEELLKVEAKDYLPEEKRLPVGRGKYHNKEQIITKEKCNEHIHSAMSI